MAKSYSEQLAEWVKARPRPTRRDKNLVAFLAVKDDVAEAVEQGWPIKTIWAHMHDQKRLVFSYDTFLSYVKRYVRAPAQPTPAPSSPPRPIRLRQLPVPGSNPTRTKVDPVGGFIFNAAPNKEELI